MIFVCNFAAMASDGVVGCGWSKTPTQNTNKYKLKGAQHTAPTKNALQSLPGIGKRLVGFMGAYSAHFLIRGKDVSPRASDYLSGLLGTYRRKNMECIHGDIPDRNYQGIQPLLSDSPWSHDQLMAQVAATKSHARSQKKRLKIITK